MALILPKRERIKERKLVKEIFKRGKTIKKFPLKMLVLPLDNEGLKFGVSVPKRNFKNAVDRNHLKRLVREAYRKNKPEYLKSGYAVFFIYVGQKKIDYHQLEHKLQTLLNSVN